MHLLLAGNPNCGKTTLFNALTGSNQKVGNWPGVTVEKKTGFYVEAGQKVTITDLPGIYTLTPALQGTSQDELLASQAISELNIDCLMNVVDACHLERHLYLTSQLLELGLPVIVVLTMVDIAKERGIAIDEQALEQRLHCPVLSVQAHKKMGVEKLKQTLNQPLTQAHPLPLVLPEATQNAVEQLKEKALAQNKTPEQALFFAYRQLESASASEVHEHDIHIADARYQAVHEVVRAVQSKTSDASEYFTAKLDKIVLNRYLGLPIFFAIMYLMFVFAINVGGAFQDFFDITTNTLFVQGSAYLLQQWHAPQWTIALLADGVGKGINTTLTFIPVIGAMFFFLSLLETSGYMARAAFVMDKLMRMLGLPGKSFVPMIVGFGCNVPAIMAARTLDSEQDRLLTVMMSPFMSCSARLAIYAVFVSAFFPTGGQNVVFSLYLMGIIMAVLTGLLLRKFMFKGEASSLILELPAYHKPSLLRLYRATLLRLKYFVIRAGRMIIPVCVLLGGLNALTWQGGFSALEANTHSVLSVFGQWLTPLFSPMGVTQDNWPATVGLLTGMLAKEVVVGTLNSLYMQLGQLSTQVLDNYSFWGGLSQAFLSIPHNLAELGQALFNPVLASASQSEISRDVYGMMAARFDGQAGAYAYLLFVLLYIPCVSTMAVIKQEANVRLMWLSVTWSFVVAYMAATLFYQFARFSLHPAFSMAWLGGMVLVVVLIIVMMHKMFTRKGGNYVNATS